jgi:DNA polymerase-3 subunit delta'
VPIVRLHGHSSLRARLREMRASGSVPSSLLFHGPTGIGKQRLALWFAQLLLCERREGEPCGQCQSCRFSLQLAHPDLHWYFPRPRLKDANPSADEIHQDYAAAIAQRRDDSLLYSPPSGAEGIFVAVVRTLVRDAALAPAMSRRKVFVIGDAERMVSQEGADQAANAFLKLLEEPPANATLVLTSSEPGALLPTVRSRLIAVRVAPLDENETRQFLADPMVAARAPGEIRELEKDKDALAAYLRSGAPGQLFAAESTRAAFQAARDFLQAATSGRRSAGIAAAFALGASGARAGFSAFLDALTDVVHSRVRGAVNAMDDDGARAGAAAIAEIQETRQLASGNVSPQLLGVKLARALARVP